MRKEHQIHIRVNDEEKQKMILKSTKLGFKQLSEYLRFIGLNSETKVEIDIKEKN
jgi:hypothetical protein